MNKVTGFGRHIFALSYKKSPLVLKAASFKFGDLSDITRSVLQFP